MPPKREFWTHAIEEILIGIMEKHPFMWNCKDVDYYKATEKKKVFEECAKVMGPQFTADVVKDRWSSIRSTFLRNKHLYEVTGGTIPPKWPLYKRLLFLSGNTNIRPPRTTHNARPSTIANDKVILEVTPDVPVYVDLADCSYRESPTPNLKRRCNEQDPIAADSPYSKHRRTTSPNRQAMLDKAMAIVDSVSSSDEPDEWEHFGAMLTANLRHDILGFNKQLAKDEIQKIILKYHKDNPANQ